MGYDLIHRLARLLRVKLACILKNSHIQSINARMNIRVDTFRVMGNKFLLLTSQSITSLLVFGRGSGGGVGKAVAKIIIIMGTIPTRG